MPNGILIIDKPADWTSMDVCAKVRGIFHEKRVGHGGTLDPMATGVLPVFVGQATRGVEFAENGQKEYVAGLRLGQVTDTQDVTGTTLETHPVTADRGAVEAALSRFLGEQDQIPPMYSAIKIGGQKLYELARKGQEVARKPRRITIHALELLEQVSETDYLLRCRCSEGTYIRTLCHDIGAALGMGAVMTGLTRTEAAGFTLADCVTIEEAQQAAAEGRFPGLLQPVSRLFAGLPAITLSEGGTVRELFVAAGDVVTAGQPLYTIYSEAAEKAVTDAQEKVNALNKELAKLQEQTADLTVKAPFAGKLVNVQDFSIDQTVSSGTEVATLVNDKKLKLSLYFSYAYENSISVGQSVTVSLTSMMKDFTGTVEKINKVRYITPEGAVQFEVVISFNNPGTLTEGMDASAAIHLSDGTVAYPYASGKLEYYESRVVTTQASGPVRSFNLLNYADVKAGDVLLTLGSDTIDDEIQAKQQEIAAAQETLNTAQQAMANFNAVAPIDGTITACTLTEGAEVKSGDTVIIISNSTTCWTTSPWTTGISPSSSRAT